MAEQYPYEDDDDETFDVVAPRLGGPVDPPDEHRTLYADIVNAHELPRTPIVPAALRNRDQRRDVVRLAASTVGYHAVLHASRSPKYAAKVALWAPVGVFRGLWKVAAWTFDFESWSIRQHAVSRNAVEDYLKLSHKRDQRVSRRLWVTGPLAAILAVGLVLLFTVAPWWWRWAALVVAAPALAWLGRPADKPILDRVTVGPKFTKLTAEMVRAALCSVGIAKIKDPGDLSFPPPGIHRDGPGWLARVNLPAGVEAVDVLERRGRLSSALRLPIDQVWPSAGPEHAGQVDLWVGYVPASKMGQPRWSLAASTARTSVFEAAEFGTDQRQRPVKTTLFARNFLIGGRPGSGKSFAGRTIVTIAALDPTAELKIVEYKGTGDFLDLAPLCSTYACGLSDEDFATGLGILTWGLAEAERRGARIKAAYERGEAPERKVTPELARKPGSGLHPVTIVIDEAHELFGDSVVGKEAGAAAERLAKRGRALNIQLVIITQIPDKDSLPTNLTRVMAMRWCLAVSDQWANDAILGTGMYKRGITATVYRPELDAGWGVLVGLAEPMSVRAQYPDPATSKAITERAKALRGGVVGEPTDPTATQDVLADVLRVFAHLGRPGVHWQQLAELLAEQNPEAYADLTPDALSALLRAKEVPSRDVKVAGVTLKGCRREHIEDAIQRREITDGGSGPHPGSGTATRVRYRPDLHKRPQVAGSGTCPATPKSAPGGTS